MGSCCTTNRSLIGEQFVRDILKDKSLLIRNYIYNELLNEVVSKRVEQEIPKGHVKQFLLPEFYDEKKTESNDVYIESIFNYIIEHLEEKNNMYIVLLYFYPFIKHDEEKVDENFFNCIRFITQSSRKGISRENVRNWLFNYISFCSWGISYAIKIKLPPGNEMNNSFIHLLNGPYSEDNLNNFLDKLMATLIEDKSAQIITLDMFKDMFKKYDISTIENIRDYLLAEK